MALVDANLAGPDTEPRERRNDGLARASCSRSRRVIAVLTARGETDYMIDLDPLVPYVVLVTDECRTSPGEDAELAPAPQRRARGLVAGDVRDIGGRGREENIESATIEDFRQPLRLMWIHGSGPASDAGRPRPNRPLVMKQ